LLIGWIVVAQPTAGKNQPSKLSVNPAALEQHVRKLAIDFFPRNDEHPEKLNAPRGLPGIDFSDHRNYWAVGYPAMMVTDTSFYRNPNYHKNTDTPATLDYQRMSQVVVAVFEAVRTMAEN
jgi:hypothetical protein